MSQRPAVFLDRDGVLNEVVWRGSTPASPRAVDELAIAPGAADAISDLRAAGFLTFGVTNQPDVARGLMSDQALDQIHDALRQSIVLDDITACRHDNADACACRKPKPGLVLDLAQRWNIDLPGSWFIGDQDRDVVCGRAAGCRTILLARFYNSGQHADHVVETLAQAIELILNAKSRSASPQSRDATDVH